MKTKYYCEYCDKRFKNDLKIRKQHIAGLAHQNAYKEHFAKFKDPKEILTNELQKKPCSHYLSGYCQFGALCRFSHFTREELDRLQQTVQEKEQREWLKQQPKTYTTDDISFFLKRRNAKQKELIYKHFLDTFNYGEMNANEIKTLPPSLQPPVNDNFKEDIVLAEWGE